MAEQAGHILTAEGLVIDGKRRCDGCGGTENLASFPDRHETLCPTCANIRIVSEHAGNHLAWLISRLVPEWQAHWLARGAEDGWLREVLEGVADGLWLDKNLRNELGYPPSTRGGN